MITLIGVCYCAGESRVTEVSDEQYQEAKSLSDVANLFLKAVNWRIVDEVFVVNGKFDKCVFKKLEGYRDTP